MIELHDKSRLKTIKPTQSFYYTPSSLLTLSSMSKKYWIKLVIFKTNIVRECVTIDFLIDAESWMTSVWFLLRSPVSFHLLKPWNWDCSSYHCMQAWCPATDCQPILPYTRHYRLWEQGRTIQWTWRWRHTTRRFMQWRQFTISVLNAFTKPHFANTPFHQFIHHVQLQPNHNLILHIGKDACDDACNVCIKKVSKTLIKLIQCKWTKS